MKRYVLALATLAMLATGAVTTAKAVEFGVGPGGVYIGPDRDRYYRDYGYRDYGAYNEYRGGCRVVITHHTNPFGEDVTIRRRICD
jgi:hypothetical protein